MKNTAFTPMASLLALFVFISLAGCEAPGPVEVLPSEPEVQHVTPNAVIENLPLGSHDLVFNADNGHYYAAVSLPHSINWSQARKASEQLLVGRCRGHLATITSQKENDFIVENLPAAFPTGMAGFWLGGGQEPGNANPTEGWRWVTGESWEYTNWRSGEPGDFGGLDERALHFHWKEEANHLIGDWNDISKKTDFVMGFVAEFPCSRK